MAITPKLEIRQSQSLLMTPQLRQAISLLQMSNLELGELIGQELERNPLLEREEDSIADAPDPREQTIDDYDAAPDSPEEFAADIDYDNSFDDYASDREGYGQDNDYAWEDYNKNKGLPAEDDFDYYQQKLAAGKSLYQHLNEQISMAFASPKDKMAAHILSEHLDAAGYFRGNIPQLALRLKCTEQYLHSILNVLKTFEPSGIFAESLSECLKIQLQDRDRYDPAIAVLLDNLELLGQRKFKELQKLCDADAEDLASMIADIRSLNPKPAAAFEHDTNTCVIPDVFVKRRPSGEYGVELNSMSLPRLLVNRSYYSRILETDKSARRYLKENLSHAGFLIRAMHQRATTILRVSEEIVRLQYDFFENGIEALKPLNLKDIAYNLEMHESTVSRAVANKFMETPRGLFELKFFFSAAAGSYIGAEDVSTSVVKHKIRRLIENETPQEILSDDKIAELLAADGTKIARRTVAKYREAMNIPGSAERKRQKRG